MAGSQRPRSFTCNLLLWYGKSIYHQSHLLQYQYHILTLFDFDFDPGDLWSGSEGGVIKIWPWEAIEKALSLTTEERHMSSLLVERSYIEPWTQVAVNGFTNILTSDVRYLLSDRSGAKVWSAGYLSFALWYVCPFNI